MRTPKLAESDGAHKTEAGRRIVCGGGRGFVRRVRPVISAPRRFVTEYGASELLATSSDPVRRSVLPDWVDFPPNLATLAAAAR